MIVALAAIDDDTVLKELGVRDSKDLSREEREALVDPIHEHCTVAVRIVTPAMIDDAVRGPSNLNWLTADVMADLINEVSPSTCIVDCPSTNIETFTSYVTRHVANDVDLDVRHKADRDEVIVGAASIIAKVKRDAVIEALHDDVGVDFGSGYPSDPKTQRFIKAHYDDYDIFRTSWGTYQAVVAEEEQQTLNNM